MSVGLLGLIAVFGLLAMLLLQMGYRLVRNRPNRYGSVLGPFGWNVIGLVFVVLTALTVVFYIDVPRPNTFVAAVGMFALAMGCFFVAQRIRSGARRDAA